MQDVSRGNKVLSVKLFLTVPSVPRGTLVAVMGANIERAAARMFHVEHVGRPYHAFSEFLSTGSALIMFHVGTYRWLSSIAFLPRWGARDRGRTKNGANVPRGTILLAPVCEVSTTIDAYCCASPRREPTSRSAATNAESVPVLASPIRAFS